MFDAAFRSAYSHPTHGLASRSGRYRVVTRSHTSQKIQLGKQTGSHACPRCQFHLSASLSCHSFGPFCLFPLALICFSAAFSSLLSQQSLLGSALSLLHPTSISSLIDDNQLGFFGTDQTSAQRIKRTHSTLTTLPNQLALPSPITARASSQHDVAKRLATRLCQARRPSFQHCCQASSRHPQRYTCSCHCHQKCNRSKTNLKSRPTRGDHHPRRSHWHLHSLCAHRYHLQVRQPSTHRQATSVATKSHVSAIRCWLWNSGSILWWSV